MSVKLYPTLKKEILFLFVLNLFGIGMIIMRYIITGRYFFFFLLWNIFLAAIPYILVLLLRVIPKLNRGVIFWLFSALWLLFLPNAPYVITDLTHLSYTPYQYLWYDILMISTFALSGLLFGFFSLRQMAKIWLAKFGSRWSFFLTSIVLFASAFGVYLGRFKRFNSWDLVHHPLRIVSDIIGRFVHPLDHPRTWAVTILVGVFLHILYFGWHGFQTKAKENFN